MKKIYSVLMALATAAITFTSCLDGNETFFTAGEDDYPRILNTNIPEGIGGERASLPSITRDNNFNFEVIVTPAQYTTVTWFIDGEQVYEGINIDYSLIAGTYDVDIVATTTKGKTTKRLCSLEVLQLETDPTLTNNAKNLWCQTGTVKTMDVTNFEGISVLYIDGAKIDDFKNEGSTITFTVPNLAEGDYNVVVENASGFKYGCGNIFVSPDKYVDPGLEKVALWEGANALNWDAENVKVTAAQLADVPVGTDLFIEYEKIPEGELAEVYWALRVIGPWWGPDLLEQTDFTNIEDNPYVLTYTEARKAIVDEQGSMSLVGNGLKIKSIYYVKAAPAESVLWEGGNALNWDAENVKVTAAQLADVAVGKTIRIYYEKMAESELAEVYWALRVIGPWWGPDLLEQTDFAEVEENPYELLYTDERKAIVDEQGSMSLVGNGLRITKITVK